MHGGLNQDKSMKGGRHMTRHLYMGIAVLAAAFIGSGCVSTGTFEKMQADKNGEIAALQKNKADLEKQKKDLEDKKASLEKDNAGLKQEADALKKQNASMQQAVGALEQ